MEKIVKDIDYNLKFITAYVTFSGQLISSEYFKLFGHFIGNRFDEKITIILINYKKFMESLSSKTIFLLEI